MSIESPTNRGNLDTMSGTLLTGDAGIDGGDTGAVNVKVYPCNGCTSGAHDLLGDGHAERRHVDRAPGLSPGVYTVQATQSDWNSQTTVTNPVTFEVRNAVFVSPFGNDAQPGSVTAPKLTVGAAVSTAGAQSRPQVAVAAGAFAPAGGTTIARQRRGARWLRPVRRLEPRPAPRARPARRTAR